MKTIEEVIKKMKHYHEMRTNKLYEGGNDDVTIAFCDGVIQSLGWAYGLPYWDMEALNGRKD